MNKIKLIEFLIFMAIATTGVMLQIIAYTSACGHPILKIVWGCN